MVTLKAHQELAIPCEYLVCEDKECNEEDLVTVYRKDDPEKTPWVSYQAGYIAYGNDFYKLKEE